MLMLMLMLILILVLANVSISIRIPGGLMRYGATKGSKTRDFSHIWADICEKSRVFDTFWRAGRTKHSEGPKTRASQRQKHIKNSMLFTIWARKKSKTLYFLRIPAEMYEKYRVFDIFSHLAWPEGGGGEQNEVWRQQKNVKNTRLFAHLGRNVRKVSSF